jgi:hypothetical protein
MLLSLGGGGADPSSSMNVIRSDGFTHQWFPRQKTPSTDWEARLDHLMDAQNKTLDFGAQKGFRRGPGNSRRAAADDFHRHPDFYAAVRSDIGNVRRHAVEQLPRDVERRGALFQALSKVVVGDGFEPSKA